MTIATAAPAFTSERVDTGHYQTDPGLYLIYLFHFVAYEWFLTDAAGKDVLDFGAGTGHGSAQLADVARSVVGVDVSNEAVAASRHAYDAPNLTFQSIAPVEDAPLPFADATFDVVVSNQVIEHVHDPAAYLKECDRVLRPGGVLFVVTPDRTTRLYAWQVPWNRHHRHEFAPQELADLVGNRFAAVQQAGMTARPDLIAREIARTGLVRNVTLPFTLPGLPDAWRQMGLKLLQWAKARKSSNSGSIDFAAKDVWISPDATPSVNICIRAKK